MSRSVIQRLALVEPPLWVHLPCLSSEPWLTLFEELASARTQGLRRGHPLTATLRITEGELDCASPGLVCLYELLLELGLLDVRSTVEIPA